MTSVVKENASQNTDKALYKSVVETANKLTDIYKQGTPERTAFSYQAQGYRFKLRERLLRLMFHEPVEFGKKAEDLLWRKVFYEPIQMAKQARKNVKKQKLVAFETFYRLHLLSGIGFYQKLLLRLQMEFNIDLNAEGVYESWIDFHRLDDPEVKSHMKDNTGRYQSLEEVQQWATKALHRCLICMGDLYRYQLDFKETDCSVLSYRYYQLAIAYRPKLGMPYNQLGTLDTASFYGLSAAYFYLRCLLSESSFDGSHGNLAVIFQKNQKRYADIVASKQSSRSFYMDRVKSVKQFIVGFLRVVEKLRSVNHVYNVEMQQLCQEVLQHANRILFYDDGDQTAISYPPVPASISVDPFKPDRLSDEAVSRVALVCIMVLTELQHRKRNANPDESDNVSDPATNEDLSYWVCLMFTLAVMDQIVNHALNRVTRRLEETLGYEEVVLPTLESSDNEEVIEESKIDTKEGANDSESVEKQISSDNEEDTLNKKSKKKSTKQFLIGRRRKLPQQMEQEGSEEDLSEGDESPLSSSSNPNDSDNSYSDSDLEYEGAASDDEESDLEDDHDSLNSQDEDEENSSTRKVEEKNSEPAGRSGQQNLQIILEEDSTSGSPKLPSSDTEVNVSCSTKSPALHRSNSGGTGSLPQTCSQLFASGSRLGLPPSLAQFVDKEEEEIIEAVDDNLECSEGNRSEEIEDASVNQQDRSSDENELLIRRARVIQEVGLLSTVKVFCDWLRDQPGILSTSVQRETKTLWSRLAILLNVITSILKLGQSESVNMSDACRHSLLSSVNTQQSEPISEDTKEEVCLSHSEWRQTVPLPEDYQLRGFSPLLLAHDKLDFSLSCDDSDIDYTLLRVQSLFEFGRYIASMPGLEFRYRRDKSVFIGPLTTALIQQTMSHHEVVAESEAVEDVQPYPTRPPYSKQRSHRGEDVQEQLASTAARRNELMRDMAQLRLQSEVSQLEAREAQSQGLPLSPYLVPDTYALCSHLSQIQKLARSGRFIIVVPLAVIDHLDHLKKESHSARHVIRYLETQSSKGNRYVRVQRSNEHGLLPHATQNKPPHGVTRAVWRWKRILDCCSYLAQAGRMEKGLVTLLTDRNMSGDEDTGAPQGISWEWQQQADKSGVAVENVTDFIEKWKTTKSKHVAIETEG